MSFESAQAQYDAMEPPDDECLVCEDECECDSEANRRLAAFAHADNQRAAMKEEGRRWV